MMETKHAKTWEALYNEQKPKNQKTKKTKKQKTKKDKQNKKLAKRVAIYVWNQPYLRHSENMTK